MDWTQKRIPQLCQALLILGAVSLILILPAMFFELAELSYSLTIVFGVSLNASILIISKYLGEKNKK